MMFTFKVGEYHGDRGELRVGSSGEVGRGRGRICGRHLEMVTECLEVDWLWMTSHWDGTAQNPRSFTLDS